MVVGGSEGGGALCWGGGRGSGGGLVGVREEKIKGTIQPKSGLGVESCEPSDYNAPDSHSEETATGGDS